MPLKDTATRHGSFDLVESVRQSLEPVQADVARLELAVLDLPKKGGSTAATQPVDVSIEAQVQSPTHALQLGATTGKKVMVCIGSGQRPLAQ